MFGAMNEATHDVVAQVHPKNDSWAACTVIGKDRCGPMCHFPRCRMMRSQIMETPVYRAAKINQEPSYKGQQRLYRMLCLTEKGRIISRHVEHSQNSDKHRNSPQLKATIQVFTQDSRTNTVREREKEWEQKCSVQGHIDRHCSVKT